MTEEFTAAEKAAAVADYLSGERCSDVAFTYGVSMTTIGRWVRKAGHEMRARAETAEIQRDRRSDW